MQQQRLINNSS